jgi:hypothetical protein
MTSHLINHEKTPPGLSLRLSGGVFFQNSPLAVENAWNQISEIFVEIWVKAGCDEARCTVATPKGPPKKTGGDGRQESYQRGCNEKGA